MGRIILVTGGARSGKSRFAEQLAADLGGRIAYIATARALDAEMADRIARHRQQRPAAWPTFEAPLSALQLDARFLDLPLVRDEAALTFSGGSALSPDAIAKAILESFERRPLEVTLPPSRGALAKLAGLAPELGAKIAPMMRRRGQRAQDLQR